MTKENYYAERKQDLRNDFVELQIGGFDRFINLAAELQTKAQRIKERYAELEKREKLGLAAEQAEKKEQKDVVVAPKAKDEKVKK